MRVEAVEVEVIGFVVAAGAGGSVPNIFLNVSRPNRFKICSRPDCTLAADSSSIVGLWWPWSLRWARAIPAAKCLASRGDVKCMVFVGDVVVMVSFG